MPTVPSNVPIGQGYTKSDWVKWFNAFTAANPRMPRYTGDNKAGKGKTWGELYPVLYSQGQAETPKLTPDQIAEAEIILAEDQATFSGVGAAVTELGTVPGITVNAAIGGTNKFVHSIPGLSGLLTTGQFLGNLVNPLLWLRVAKVTIGAVILVVGLAKLTGADKTIGGIAAKAVKTAPLL